MNGVCQRQKCQNQNCIGIGVADDIGEVNQVDPTTLTRQHGLDCTGITPVLMENYPGPAVAPGATVLDNLLYKIQSEEIQDLKKATRDASMVIRDILLFCRDITVKENGGWQSGAEAEAQDELEERSELVRESSLDRSATREGQNDIGKSDEGSNNRPGRNASRLAWGARS